MGVRMTVEEDAIFVEEQDDLKPVDIKTSPYPVLRRIYNNQ